MSATHKVIVWYDTGFLAWVSNCMCGWGSKRRATKEAATRDGEGHYGGQVL